MDSNKALEAFRGVILSDGNLDQSRGVGNAYFSMSLSDNKKDLTQREQIPTEELLKFLQHFVVEVLEPLEVKTRSRYPRVEPRIGKNKDGEWISGVRLITQVSEFLTGLYHKYYPNDEKAISEDFILTDVLLAWFFMLDGNSAWNVTGRLGVSVTLYTQGLSLRSVELFEEQLYKFGVNTGRKHVRVVEGTGVAITILADSVDRFMDIVNPYIVPPYRYKVKYRGSCPSELAERYREHHNKYMREWRRKKLFSDLKHKLGRK